MRIKNTIPTSFSIDLSTVDVKVERLVRFLQNSSIDLKDNGRVFKHTEPTYESVVNTLQNRKYKEQLSELVSNVYTKRFAETKQKLIEKGVATDTDFLLVRPMDDFGSTFDAFAATNTDPNNSILSILNVEPYRFLQVDIFEQEEIKTYLSNISTATYDVNKLTYIISILDSITTSYVDSLNFNFSFRNFSKEVEEKVLSIKTKTKALQEQQLLSEQPVGDSPPNPDGQQQTEFLFSLVDMVSAAINAINLISAYNQSSLSDSNKLVPTGASNIISNYPAGDISLVIGQELYDNQIARFNEAKKYDSRIIETAKIKIVSYILKNEIQKILEEKISAISFLNDFRPKYTNYNFFEKRLFSPTESKTLPKEQLFFRLTYLRSTEQQILQTRQKLFSPLNVEFINRQFISLQSPFGPSQRNEKFVAIIGGEDIAAANNYVDFFDPTILNIMSDIDYIASNIAEIDPFYCPIPQSLQPGFDSQRADLRSNETDINNITKSRHYVESNPSAFTYFTFPDQYFIPNFLRGPEDFFESSKKTLTKNMMEETILRYSKYSYSSDAETPVANIIRDENISTLLQDSLLYDGFGPYAVKKNSFSDPVSIKPIINGLLNLGDNAAAELQSIVFARTNIACLLKEFQTCFMPQMGNCRDILRGFRFTELQQVIERAFPRSIYSTLYVSIEQFLIDNAKDERERELLREIKEIEKQLKNNDRKAVAFAEMDRRKEPAEALNIADQSAFSREPGMSLEELYQQKLQEYKQLKLNQEAPEVTEQDKLSARRQMQPDELQQIDSFLDMLEERGINTDILCSLVDLFRISPTFGTITLPELPQFDIYSEVKLSVNLAVAKLVIDTIVAFIVKILEELLTCGGIKNLLSAAITGEAGDSVTGAAAGALNQISRGTFDLDEFVESNPQADPVTYAKGMADILNRLPESVTAEETTAFSTTLDFGVAGEVKVNAKTRAQSVLLSPRASPTTETEVKVALVGLVDSLSRVLTPNEFMELVSGNAAKNTIAQVSTYIEQNQPQLSYLSSPSILRSIFSYMGRISGLDSVRNELISVSTFYTTSRPKQEQLSCLDPASPTVIDIDRTLDDRPSSIADFIQPTPDDKYRKLLEDLLTASPSTLKNKVDEEIFKPLLMGMLPDGKKLSSVDAAKKGIIRSAFDTTAGNFKEKTNDLYSKLVYKKQVTREVLRNKDTKDEDGTKKTIENPEYRDLINKGGYPADYAGPIEVTEKRYVYGGLFTENFTKSSKNLNISSTQEELKVSLNGNVGYKDDQEEQVNTSMGKTWKFENTINSTNNVYKVYENGREKFSYEVQDNNREKITQVFDVRREFNNKLKQTVDTATNGSIDNNIFQQYTNKAYSDFISLIYEKVTKQISNDGLLKPINPASMNAQSFITGMNNNLAGIFPGFEDIGKALSELPAMINPFIDTPMKYINFCPKPTKEQKNNNIDPGLYGKIEVEQLVYNLLEKREKEIIDLKTLQQMLSDNDNTINFALIDGMYFSLVRGMSVELAMRAIFPFRTFKFDGSLIEDLMIPTYGSELLYAEIQQYAGSINKNSIVDFSHKHIQYLHDFVFADKLGKPENDNLFLEIYATKEQITKLQEDKDIINSYLGKFYGSTVLSQQDKQYKDKLINYLSCLKQEIKQNTEKLCKLQIRNLIYNEMLVILDKLSYITSTNQKVKEELAGECRDNQEEESENNLQTLITDVLLQTSLHEVTALYSPDEVVTAGSESAEDREIRNTAAIEGGSLRRVNSDGAPKVDNSSSGNLLEIKNFNKFLTLQEKKFADRGASLFLEHYINVPFIKQQDQALRREQERLGCFGATTFAQFKKLIELLPRELNVPVEFFFSGPITYEMRMVYAPSAEISPDTSVESEEFLSSFIKIKNENKNKFIIRGNNNQKNALSFIAQGSIPANQYDKTYSIPYAKKNSDNKIIVGLINAFPIVTVREQISTLGVATQREMLSFIDTIANTDENTYTDRLKLKLSCNEELSDFYKILTNKNLLSNMMIFSSMEILGNEDIKLNFSSIREKLFSSIVTKLTYTYSKDEFGELLEKLGTTQYFKQFNADLAVKLSIRAAIYVLQYYCQMTDPNISIALLIRNAIKIALSVASQVPVPGNNVPSELPLPLTPLAIYSMAQLPITVFGVPPAGIGVGPPLTIPGMVLLGAEAILLALEFSFDIDANSNNEKINKQLKDMCFDLAGYKKYGIE